MVHIANKRYEGSSKRAGDCSLRPGEVGGDNGQSIRKKEKLSCMTMLRWILYKQKGGGRGAEGIKRQEKRRKRKNKNMNKKNTDNS